MKFEDVVRRTQAKAVAELFAGGIVKVFDDKGTLLVEHRIAETYELEASGAHITFPPPSKGTVLSRGDASVVAFFSADRKTRLGMDFAGDHPGALLRYEDHRLFERMIVDIENPLVLEMREIKE